jgi:hypothetical protein
VYGKTVVVRYARQRSNQTVRREGGRVGLEREKAARRADRLERAKYPRLTKRQRLAQAMAMQQQQLGSGMVPPYMSAVHTAAAPIISPTSLELPNKTIFVQGIPADLSTDHLIALFKRYIGFVEFRRAPNRPDLGFVEYETDAQASVPRQALDRHELRPGQPIRVTFARR